MMSSTTFSRYQQRIPFFSSSAEELCPVRRKVNHFHIPCPQVMMSYLYSGGTETLRLAVSELLEVNLSGSRYLIKRNRCFIYNDITIESVFVDIL